MVTGPITHYPQNIHKESHVDMKGNIKVIIINVSLI
jgi:hypothetical protein